MIGSLTGILPVGAYELERPAPMEADVQPQAREGKLATNWLDDGRQKP